MDQITQLALYHAAVESFSNYAEGIDSKNWPLVRSCFSDEVTINYGEIDSSGEGGTVRVAEDWVAHLRSVIDGFDETHHSITNHRLSVEDGRVNCRAYLVADHVILPDPAVAVAGPEDICTVVGEYSNDYEQHSDGRWTICYSRLTVKWSSGNVGVFATAAQRVAAASA